eukprot:997708-Prorocentrum_minimum.AAC.1
MKCGDDHAHGDGRDLEPVHAGALAERRRGRGSRQRRPPPGELGGGPRPGNPARTGVLRARAGEPRRGGRAPPRTP